MSLRSFIKGALGELMGSAASSLFLDKQVYRTLNNVTIATSNGTTQIDHVIVSRYGVFVIETKNFQGWIFGAENQAQWTQSLPGGRKFRFQNPIRQNYRHIKALSDFLGLSENHFHSVVMFWGESEFKTPMPANVMSKGYATYIKSKTMVLWPDEKVEQIVVALQTGRLPSGLISGIKTRQQHIASLEERHGSSVRCPKCGAGLVERQVKSGERTGQNFLGCSEFPKCRFMRALPE